MKQFVWGAALWMLMAVNANAAIYVLQPDGTKTNKTSLAAAATATDGAGKTVVVTSAYTVGADLTWPADRGLTIDRSGLLTIAAGKTLAMNGVQPIIGQWKAFAGSGTVTGLKEAWPIWFGAAGDGATADSVAVQKTIDAVATGTIYLPGSGAYLVKNIQIANKTNFTIVSAGAKFLLDPASVANNRMFLIGAGNVNVEFRDVEFDGNIANAHGNDTRTSTTFDVPIIDTYISSGTPTQGLKIIGCNVHDVWYEAIRILNVPNLAIDDTTVTNSDVSLDLRGCASPKITNSTVSGGTSEALWTSAGCSNVVLAGNHFFKHSNIDGISGLTSSGNLYYSYAGYAMTFGQFSAASSNLMFTGDHFYGVVETVTAFPPSGLKFKSCDFNTIAAGSTALWTNNVNDLAVNSCTFTYPSTTTANANTSGLVIIVGSSSTGLTFKNNTVQFRGSAGQKPNILVKFQGYSNAEISGDTFDNGGVSGIDAIYLASMDAATLIIKDNQTLGSVVSGFNLNSHFPYYYENNFSSGTYIPTTASAGTMTLVYQTSSLGNVIQVSGTTNITSITAARKGKMVTLLFQGVLTVTNGSNLKLRSDYVTAANATLTLICDGTNWIEVSRSKVAATAQVDTTAADLAALKVDFNALLAKLRTAGLMAP